ncbi:MAG TPA: hypothetical protein P5526_25085 [Anaerolineae bacterium]|nr:hypothetical protein [Anaerolineae bacterium]MCB0179699.1 hypothetical protein [Anaerolineae bacterium]MCB9104714.1 hypothetical protein [Anaerolineales bacterium]HRV95457.1 hypothetical protein [Anaerolineae bacterium]
MTVTDLLQSAQFVVDANGNRQAVQFDIAQWDELITLLKNIEAWEQKWHQPFDSIRVAWDTSEPAPDEDTIPDDETLVDLVHQTRDETI